MRNNFKIFFLILTAFFLLSFKSEETPFEKLLKQLAKLTAAYPIEKVHLHLDKPYYAVGEDIWLKAYLVTAEKNEPSNLSKVLYVDLINEKNEICKKLTLPVVDGRAFGNISLLDSIGSGNHRLRAYTNYMRNYDQGFFFEKSLTIGNVLDKPDAKNGKEKKLSLDVQFFPEGGTLVAGNRTKIGVKAVTSDGFGANLAGYVINRKQEKIVEFSTEHAGMGAFAFTPTSGEGYKAVVILSDGTEKSYEFPKVVEEGYALAVNISQENLSVRIFGSVNAIGKSIFVIAQSNGTVYGSHSGKIEKSNLLINFPKKDFPTGIIHITLFDYNTRPVAERLIFLDKQDHLRINLNPQDTVFKTKKKVAMNMTATDGRGNLVDGYFSVAVVDENKVPYKEDDDISILSNILLTSDLKGYIEQPNYYFNPNNSAREKYLDHLMLTQGWRRFGWEDILTEKEPKLSFRAEQSLEISGIVTLANKPLPDAKISLFSTWPKLKLNLDTLANADGFFLFDRLDLPDSASFMIQAKTKTDSKNLFLRLYGRPPVISALGTSPKIDIFPYMQVTKERYVELNKYNLLDMGISLKEVNITGQRRLAPIVNIKGSKNLNGSADYVITSKMLEGAIDIFSPFHKSPGVLVKQVGPRTYLYRTRQRSSLTANPPMLLIVDGVQINQLDDPEFIKSINLADIEGIEILTSNYNLSILGPDAVGGAIYITTKSGASRNTLPATNIARLNNVGYSTVKKFYSPAYDDPKTNSEMRDLRSTIYWNPNLNTNIRGEANFTFFNASTPGNYRVIIEGFDAFGNLGRKTYTYVVK